MVIFSGRWHQILYAHAVHSHAIYFLIGQYQVDVTVARLVAHLRKHTRLALLTVMIAKQAVDIVLGITLHGGVPHVVTTASRFLRLQVAANTGKCLLFLLGYHQFFATHHFFS